MSDEVDPADKAGDDEAENGADKTGKRWRIVVEIAVAAGGLITAVTGLINALNGSGGPT